MTNTRVTKRIKTDTHILVPSEPVAVCLCVNTFMRIINAVAVVIIAVAAVAANAAATLVVHVSHMCAIQHIMHIIVASRINSLCYAVQPHQQPVTGNDGKR